MLCLTQHCNNLFSYISLFSKWQVYNLPRYFLQNKLIYLKLFDILNQWVNLPSLNEHKTFRRGRKSVSGKLLILTVSISTISTTKMSWAKVWYFLNHRVLSFKSQFLWQPYHLCHMTEHWPWGPTSGNFGIPFSSNSNPGA